MYQIDNSTAAAAQPPSSAAGTAGFFTDGNPASNIPATIVPAEWLNSVMMEIMNAVTGSGQTLNKAAFNQLWTAIQNTARNAGLTPPQFDNSTKTATTAYVQHALGSFSGLNVITANTAMTAAHAGTLNLCGNGSNPLTMTLPPSASVIPGTCIDFQASNTGTVTIVPAGADQLWFAGGAQANPVLGQGDTAKITYQGSGIWQVCAGSVQLKYAAIFGALFGTAGYQKLPSGFVLNWANLAANGAGQVGLTFPAAYPNAYVGSSAIYLNSSGSPQPSAITVAEIVGGTKTSVTYICSGAGAAVANANVKILAWGY